MSVWYCGSTNWTAVTAWAAETAYSVGDLRRQLAAPTVGSERVFRCTTAGTSLAAEPSWTLTKGATTTEVDGPVWTEVTGNTAYGWTAAHARLANALAWMAAGDTVYVSDNHAETQATAMVLTSLGTGAAPCLILCVDDAATPPTALAITGTLTTTEASGIDFAGFAYCYGLAFYCGTGTTACHMRWATQAPWGWRLDSCNLYLNITSANLSLIYVGVTASGANQLLEWVNTSVRFANAVQYIRIACQLRWWNSSGIGVGGTVPTTLFQVPVAPIDAKVVVSGVDLTALHNSGHNLVTASGAFPSSFTFRNCKLAAGVNITTGAIAGPDGCEVNIINCDSGDTNYNYQKTRFQGSVYDETTIVRTGGASDGTTPISRKMVTGTGSQFFSPLESDPCIVWNETTGSAITATVEVVTDNVTLTDAEAWIEVEYLGTSGFPLSLVTSDRAADVMATPANQTASTVTWTTTGLATPVKQKLSIAFTPQEKGPVRVRVMLAKASTTMYFCPKVDIT